jgi:hypothetical protein
MGEVDGFFHISNIRENCNYDSNCGSLTYLRYERIGVVSKQSRWMATMRQEVRQDDKSSCSY